MSMDEAQAFIHSLRYHHLTSQQRKTLRGQALAGKSSGCQERLAESMLYIDKKNTSCSVKKFKLLIVCGIMYNKKK